MAHPRWTQRGQRPVRIANCSGAKSDPGYQMLRQATLGDVDFITGDYLAELNLAQNAVDLQEGKGEGFEPTAWDGLQQTLDVLAQKRIKVAINGGAIAPERLAMKTRALVAEKGLDLKVAFVTGDDKLSEVKAALEQTGGLPYPHLDSENDEVQRVKDVYAFQDSVNHPIVTANVYLGARGIVKAFEAGADIVICGRVADASPVIAAAWYWYSWKDTDYNQLAGGLIAGHLIECSAYVTGSNFAGFTDYPLEDLIDIGFPIAEVEPDGSCVITKHEGTKGLVTVETVKCQLLYELQGNVYLNSDVKAYLDNIVISSVGKDRIRVTGTRGSPPPPTTKLTVFYKGGYQSQLLLNATGYATAQKWVLQEAQIRYNLYRKGLLSSFSQLSFQVVGNPAYNPTTQLSSTTYLRVFAQAPTAAPLVGLLQSWAEFGMQHFAGMHNSMDFRTAMPEPFLSLFPALYPQKSIREYAHVLGVDGEATISDAGNPPQFEELQPRENYDPMSPTSLSEFGETERVRLGDAVLARSGDKGSNVNIGLFPRSKEPRAWEWLRSWLTRERMKSLIGDDWREEYFIERVEFPKIAAVHFVVYGILGRGVSGSTLLDCLGKGFAEYIRYKLVDVPSAFLETNVDDGRTLHL